MHCILCPGEQKMTAMVTLVLLIGIFQLIVGLLKMGSLIKFVSQSVMTGFITGIALNIVIGALPDLTGYTTPYYVEIPMLADMVLNFHQFETLTTLLGLTTIALIIGFGYTRLKKFALVLSLIVITIVSLGLTAAFGVESIEVVGDIAYIPRALPIPMLPDLSLMPTLVMPAIAIGIIGLVQGAGVGQSFPNPDGKYPDASRDFAGQGLANIAAGFFQGIPGGGSMSGTAVTVNAGSKSRWSNIFAGLLVAVIVLLFANAVKLVPMTALGGLLVVVGFQNIRPRQIELVWSTGWVARTAMLLTLMSTLIMPLQYAISVGVAISIVLHVVHSSNRVEIVQIVPIEGGFPDEQPAPAELSSGEVTLLHTYGSLFFASASTFEQQLPMADDAQRAVVILLLRGQPEVGSTFIGVLRRYAEALQANGGKLMLAGVGSRLHGQLDRTGTTALLGDENLFPEQTKPGAAMNKAVAAARVWLEQTKAEPTEGA